MLLKAKKRHLKKVRTKLKPIEDNTKKWVVITYCNKSDAAKKVIEKHTSFNVVFKTNNNKKIDLPKTKDKTPHIQKSGIYEISCNVCNMKYIGQTKININTRYKEHLAHARYNRPENLQLLHI